MRAIDELVAKHFIWIGTFKNWAVSVGTATGATNTLEAELFDFFDLLSLALALFACAAEFWHTWFAAIRTFHHALARPWVIATAEHVVSIHCVLVPELLQQFW